jgi:hypothetical protein
MARGKARFKARGGFTRGFKAKTPRPRAVLGGAMGLGRLGLLSRGA